MLDICLYGNNISGLITVKNKLVYFIKKKSI